MNFACLCLLSCIILFARIPIPTTYAQEGTNLEISPSNIYIETNPPSDARAPFTIKNNSDRSVSLAIGYKVIDPLESANGRVIFKENPSNTEKEIFKNIQIVDEKNVSYDSIELGPKQEKQLQMRVILPQQQFQNDYYFTLFFQESPSQSSLNTSIDNEEDQKAYTSLISGIGINSFIAIGQKTTPQLEIEEFSTSWVRQTGPVPFSLKLTNAGLHYTRPQGKIVIRNMFGNVVGTVALPKRAILASTTREVLTESQDPITWKNIFLIGSYTAELIITDNNDYPIASRTIRFFAIPFILLVGLLIIVIGIGFIVRRTGKKHK